MIVVLEKDADVDAAVARGKREHGVKPTNVFKHAARGYAANLSRGQARAIEREPVVDAVVQDTVVELAAQVTPAGVRRVGATRSPLTHIDTNDLASHRANVDVAIIDTGIQPEPSRPARRRRLRLHPPGHAAPSDRSSSRWRDEHGHGTHVAGIVGALDNDRGVVGVAPGARLWSVRVFTATRLQPDLVDRLRDRLGHVEARHRRAGRVIEVANMSLRDEGRDDGNCGYSNVGHRAPGDLPLDGPRDDLRRRRRQRSQLGRELAAGVVQRGHHGVGDGRLRRQAGRPRERRHASRSEGETAMTRLPTSVTTEATST